MTEKTTVAVQLLRHKLISLENAIGRANKLSMVQKPAALAEIGDRSLELARQTSQAIEILEAELRTHDDRIRSLERSRA